jgi:hypothetical protein
MDGAHHGRRAIYLLIGCGALTLVLFALRASFVPDAQSVTSIYPQGITLMLFYTYFPRLFEPLPVSVGIVTLLIVWVAALFNRSRRALVWLLVSGIALAPTLVSPRANNLFVPLVFLGAFFADTLLTTRKVRLWERRFAAFALLLLIAGNFVSHRLAQQTLAPDSVDRVTQADWYLNGEWQYSLDDIPPARIASLERALLQTPQARTRWLASGWSFP